eukprot:scaffold44370_cov82-Phaeocystis_antarctica.AAC.4
MRGSPRHPRHRSRQRCARGRSLATAPLVCRLASYPASCSLQLAHMYAFMWYYAALLIAPLAIAQTSLAPLWLLRDRASCVTASNAVIARRGYSRSRNSPCVSSPAQAIG